MDGQNTIAGKLRGKTALVTGAGKRIGREISLALAAEGTNIIVHYLSGDGGRHLQGLIDG